MTNLNPNVPVHSAASFHWKGSVGTAEASELPPVLTGRVFRDTVAVGFKLRSPITGREAVMVQSMVEKDSKGEVVSTFFVSVAGVDRSITVRVFND